MGSFASSPLGFIYTVLTLEFEKYVVMNKKTSVYEIINYNFKIQILIRYLSCTRNVEHGVIEVSTVFLRINYPIIVLSYSEFNVY